MGIKESIISYFTPPELTNIEWTRVSIIFTALFIPFIALFAFMNKEKGWEIIFLMLIVFQTIMIIYSYLYLNKVKTEIQITNNSK